MSLSPSSDPRCISTAFLRGAISEELSRLRSDCRFAKAALADARRARTCGMPAYWIEIQAGEAIKREREYHEIACRLASHIEEHKAFMPDGWMPDGHGRLCWDAITGGYPITTRWCELPECHGGNHTDHDIEWPTL